MSIAHDLKVFPSHVLFDLARNESAPLATRFMATEELIDRDDRRSLHPDLATFAREILDARLAASEEATDLRDEIMSRVQHEESEDSPENEQPALKASFTTDSL